MSKEVVTIEKERISYAVGAIIGGISGVFIGLVNCFFLAMFRSGNFLEPTIAICILLAIVGCIIGLRVVNQINHRRKIYIDAEYISYGSMIGALTGLFVCVGYCVIELPDDVNAMYPVSILTLAILGTITSGIVSIYVNEEIKELEEQKIAREKELKKKVAEQNIANEKLERDLSVAFGNMQALHRAGKFTERNYADIIETFELCKNIPPREITDSIKKELDKEKQKIYTETLNNASEGNSILAISGFRALSWLEPDNHEYRTAIERLTDTNKLIESAKSKGFDLTSEYANTIRRLVEYIK
jgi:hypothetical protein